MILHLIKTVDGASWALRQIRELVRRGFRIGVVLPSSVSGLAPRYREVGAQVIEGQLDFSPLGPREFASAARRLQAIVEDGDPGLIHSHFVSTTLIARVALGRRGRVPRLFQVPGPLHLEHAAFRRLDLATSGPADRWIGSCRWTCDEYRRQGIEPERVFLSYYGTDVDQLAGGTRGAFRNELGLGPDVPLVGMVAYMYAPKTYLGQARGLKGHEDFIDAFGQLLRKRPDARAVIVGGPWNGAHAYERRLRRRARAVCGDAIVFTGHRGDIANVYADLDLAVHPSLSENCGGAVESLAAACPTVASAVGGLPDVVIDGETGWLVPPRDPRALSSTMLEALGDRQEGRRRAYAGRDLVRHLFDVRRTAAEIAGIYRIVLGQAASPSRDAGEPECTLASSA